MCITQKVLKTKVNWYLDEMRFLTTLLILRIIGSFLETLKFMLDELIDLITFI